MNTTVRRGAVVFLVVLSTACGSSAPSSPTAIPQPLPVAAPTALPPRTFPPLSGPSRTFVFDRELKYRVSDYTRKSSFMLYDNGAFVLRYGGPGEVPRRIHRGRRCHHVRLGRLERRRPVGCHWLD
jgi:hypothetical protein